MWVLYNAGSPISSLWKDGFNLNFKKFFIFFLNNMFWKKHPDVLFIKSWKLKNCWSVSWFHKHFLWWIE